MPGICGVCQRVEARYTCPRCQLGYCSLPCYKCHGDKCTENFYKTQVQEELRSQRATGPERRRLERVVAELSNLGSPDDPLGPGPQGEADSEDEELERLQALAAKAERGELSLEDLTEEEARRFHSELKRGALGQALGPWEPWWCRAVVVEVDLDALDGVADCAPAASSAAAVAAVPPAHLCCAGGREAHGAVAFTLLEVLYAYAHTMRAFNGDWAWDPLQGAQHLLHLGTTICSRKVYEAAGECLHAVLAAAATLPGGGFGRGLDALCLADVASILEGGGLAVARSLQETAALLEAAAGLAEERPASSSAKAASKLRLGVKKLAFLASFAHYHQESFTPLAMEVRAQEKVRREELEAREQEESRRLHGGIAVPPR